MNDTSKWRGGNPKQDVLFYLISLRILDVVPVAFACDQLNSDHYIVLLMSLNCPLGQIAQG